MPQEPSKSAELQHKVQESIKSIEKPAELLDSSLQKWWFRSAGVSHR